MEYSLYDFLRLIGSLGFFLYGMKLMSEALQKVAGDKMRNILSSMTSNRVKGVITGILITAFIQSSSATTVMVVSFVNAGLLTLVQSIGVIMGANIGTTVTAWIITLLGFKVNISMFALPLIGVAIPFVFSKVPRRASIGQLIIGFAILFMGLDFLKNSVPDINGNPQILEFIARYSSMGFQSILIFLITGSLLTIVIQSSSAVMALTLVMCFNGWIDFPMAAAMVLGENIGTTVTANLAAIVVNTTAKRAARAHLIFNMVGVFIVLVLFMPFIQFIDWFLVKINLGSPLLPQNTLSDNHVILPIALSVFHTTFNILNTLLQIWFIPSIARAVTWMIPVKDEDDEIFKLKYISTNLLSVDEIAMVQAKKEIGVFIERSLKMFNLVRELAQEDIGAKKTEKLIAKIRKYEEIADRIEEEIATFVTQLSSSKLSKNSSENINALLKLVSRIESMDDACYNTAELLYLRKNKKMKFTDEMNKNIESITQMTEEMMKVLPEKINMKNPRVDVVEYRNKRDEIDLYAEKLNLIHLKDIKKGTYKYKVGMVYCDSFQEIAVIANHAYHSLKYINELTI